MSSERLLDYPAAVALADSALTAILEPLRRPESTWTFEDRHTAAIAFHSWLTEQRPDVLEVLEEAGEWFEPMMMETYMEAHSAAWEVWVNEGEPGEPLHDPTFRGDGVLIRLRPA